MSAHLVGTNIGPYKLVKHLGDGGMGSIFQASRADTSDLFALKLLLPEFSRDDEFRRRFERESAVMRQLEHPHIIPTYDSGEDRGYLYFVMYLVNGISLFDLTLKRHFSPVSAYQILNPIASALDYAHERGVIHRDIKPGNILIDVQGEGTDQRNHVYLVDFGLSKVNEWVRLTQAGMSVGTPQYMSPEQVLDYPLTAASDIYSLAVVVYELLLGRLPFYGKKAEEIAMAHVEKKPPKPRDLHPDFPTTIEAVLLRALDKKPENRYQKASEFSDDFSEAARLIPQEQRKGNFYVGPPSR